MSEIAFTNKWEGDRVIKPVYAFVCPFTDTLIFGIFHRNAAGEKHGAIRLERNNKAREYTKHILGQKSFIVSCLDTGKTFGESTYYVSGHGDVVGNVTHFHSFSGSLEGAAKGLIEHISPKNIVKAEAVVKAIQNICADPGNPLFPYVKLTKEVVRGAGIMISLYWEKEEQLAGLLRKQQPRSAKV